MRSCNTSCNNCGYNKAMNSEDYDILLPLQLEAWQGSIAIRLQAEVIVEVDMLADTCPRRSVDSPLAERIIHQLQDYLEQPQVQGFQLPLSLAGTAFQQQVWAYLQRIPAGRVESYGEVAKALGSGAQAVGNACRANPIPLFIPCHRVVAANGLGGYGGARSGRQWQLKPALLRHEGAI